MGDFKRGLENTVENKKKSIKLIRNSFYSCFLFVLWKKGCIIFFPHAILLFLYPFFCYIEVSLLFFKANRVSIAFHCGN